MLKIIGSLMILISSGILGFYYASTFYRKVRILRAMQYAINLLEADILYTSSPLGEAFERAGKRAETPINHLFLFFAEGLIRKSGIGMDVLFSDGMKKLGKELMFNQEEMDVAGSFFTTLGTTDLEGQKKNFNITIKKLDELERMAEEKRIKNEKLFRYLGVCTGMLIVIILV